MDKLITNPKFQFILSTGAPASGYKLFIFESGTTTKKTVYTTRAESVESDNPITLNTYGMVPGSSGIFCTGTFKLGLYLPAETDPPTGDPIFTMDDLRVSYAATLADADGDTQIQVEESSDEDKIRFDTGGTQRVLIDADGLTLASGASVNEFSTDGTLAGNSDDAVPTEKAARTYLTAALRPLSTIANNASDAEHDIDFAVGTAPAHDYSDIIYLSSALTKKIDATWAAGTDQGGLFTGTVANDTWYHCFVIKNPTTGTVDAGFDTSVTAANIPEGYTKYWRVGSILTDGSANILAFSQHFDEFLWDDPPLDIDVADQSTTTVARTLSVPIGVKVRAILQSSVQHATDAVVDFREPDRNDEAPAVGTAPNGVIRSLQNGKVARHEVRTNTSAQIYTRSSAASTAIKSAILGWIDKRGKD